MSSCCGQKRHTDLDCMNQIDEIIINELRKETKLNYDSLSKDLGALLAFYVNDRHRLDSVRIFKSNLTDFGYSDEKVIEELMRHDFECLRDIYYSGYIKPPYITVPFKPSRKL